MRVLQCPLYHHIRVCFQIQLPYEINQVACFISSHAAFLFLSFLIFLYAFHSDQLSSPYKSGQKPQSQAAANWNPEHVK
jgi:hypothetical protein